MSEYIVWHESQVYKLPADVTLKIGCLLEPTSVAVRVMDKVHPSIGQRVAIVGAGPIGLLSLQMIKMMGATSLTLVEPIAERRDLAIQYGADHTVDPVNEDVISKAMELTDGRGYDIVIDCSGSVRAIQSLPRITAKGGTLLFAAMYPGDYEFPLNLYQYCYANELTISGFFISPYTYPRAMQIMPRLDLDALTAKLRP